MNGNSDWSWRPDKATIEALRKGHSSAHAIAVKPQKKKRAPKAKYSLRQMAEIAEAYQASQRL